MAYADQQMSGNKIAAIVLVVLIHLGIGYLLISGLAYSAFQEVVETTTTYDFEEEPEPEPPEEEPEPPEEVPENGGPAALRTSAAGESPDAASAPAHAGSDPAVGSPFASADNETV